MTWDLMTIDPGKYYTACALWVDRHVDRVMSFANNHDTTSTISDFTECEGVLEVIVEDQYVNKRSSVPAEHMIDMAFWGGAYAIAARPLEGVIRVAPRTWKGTVPKELMLRRIIDRMEDDELRAVGSPRLLSKLLPPKLSNVVPIRRSTPSRIPGPKRLPNDPESDIKRLTDKLDAVGIGLWHYERL